MSLGLILILVSTFLGFSILTVECLKIWKKDKEIMGLYLPIMMWGFFLALVCLLMGW